MYQKLKISQCVLLCSQRLSKCRSFNHSKALLYATSESQKKPTQSKIGLLEFVKSVALREDLQENEMKDQNYRTLTIDQEIKALGVELLLIVWLM